MSRWSMVCLLVTASFGAMCTFGAEIAPPRVGVPLLVTQLPISAGQVDAGRSEGMLRAEYGGGARIVLITPDGSRRVLTDGFHGACDPDVAFDGSKFLFAGKRAAGDRWNIFELTLADGSIRQITHDAGNCRSPVYQSTLYTLDSSEPWYQLTFVSDATAERNEDGSGPATHLYSCKLDGSSVRRLTYNLSSDFDPLLMKDGRLLFSSWQRSTLARGPRGRIRLFGVNLDGTDYALFADPSGPVIQHMPCVTASGWVIFIAADRVSWDGAGQLAGVSYRRPLRSFRTLTDPGDGLFHSPAPLPDGAVLVSRRAADGSGTHAVVRFDPETGRWQAVFDDPDWHDIQPRAIYRRDLADGRSSVVNEQKSTGKLYCLNVYVTDFEQPDWLPPGSVKRVRLLEGIPSVLASEDSEVPTDSSSGRESAATDQDGPRLALRRILGEAEVMADGSFHVEVPANTPLELQALDADGLALRSCSWIWVRNHENRGCIGCHEDGELSPENHFADALSLAGTVLAPPPDQRRTIDFRRDLVPIIRARCVPCHTEGQAEPRLDGSFRLLSSYVRPGQARTSPLIWHIFGRNTSRPWDDQAAERPFKPIPPGQVDPLSDDEKRLFVEWIDLGAPWLGTEAP